MTALELESYIIETLLKECARLGIEAPELRVELSRQPELGELSCNAAMACARQVGMPPLELANKFAAAFETHGEFLQEVTAAKPGFLNFRLRKEYLRSQVAGIVSDPGGYGAGDLGKEERWLFEFVSANPTGPLNVVSARAAAVGDSLVRVFKRHGYEALSEYYVNDAGMQVRNLGASVRARMWEAQGRTDWQIPEGGYHGEYVAELARELVASDVIADALDDQMLGRIAADRIREGQEQTLNTFGVRFDKWFRESELYGDDRVDAAFDKLQSAGHTYIQDGACYFKASEFGDSADRVVKTSDGRYTYVVPDIAYHIDKQRRGAVKAVTVLGPDHHGHIAQLSAALKAVGLPKGFYTPLLIQQVNLKRGGEEVKMSKRAGVGITLDDLIGEIGVDAARFFFLMRRCSSHLDFDIELAKRRTDENPVFYVQYAHARICSIFRQPGAFEPDPGSNLGGLDQPEELEVLRALFRFPFTLTAVVRNLEPHPITVYLTELARAFHLFYQRHRVIGDDRDTTAARLLLCRAVADILREGLGLIGVDAPERM